MLYSVERTAKCSKRSRPVPGLMTTDSAGSATPVERESPEQIGEEAAMMLLEEIYSGENHT